MRNFLLLILLFFIGSWISRKLRQAQQRTARGGPASDAPGGRGPGFGRARPGPGSAGNRTASLPEPMVRCAHCGVHTPKGEAVSAGGDYFCSADHAARHTTSAGRGA